MLHISPSEFSNWVHEKRHFPFKSFKEMCRIGQCNHLWLMGLESNRVPQVSGIKNDNLLELQQASDLIQSAFNFLMTAKKGSDNDVFDMAMEAWVAVIEKDRNGSD